MKQEITNLTPEAPDDGYRKWGESVMAAALLELTSLPKPITAAIEEQRAIIVSLYGDDLNHILAWHKRYMKLCRGVIATFYFEHKEAGPVLSLIYEVEKGAAPKIVSEVARGGQALN